MLKNLLLPHRFKRIGWGLLIGAICLLPLLTVGDWLLGIPWQWTKAIMRTGMIVAMIAVCLVTLSKEKIEDEYIASLRSQTLTAVFYLFFILSVLGMIGSTLQVVTWFDLDRKTLANLAISQLRVTNIWFVFMTYIVIFNTRLWLMRLRARSEK